MKARNGEKRDGLIAMGEGGTEEPRVKARDGKCNREKALMKRN